MGLQHEYDDRPSVQLVPRLCEEAHKDGESSKLLDGTNQTEDIPMRVPVASAACKCRCSSHCAWTQHTTSPFRPGEIKELQRLLRFSYAVNVAFFILIFVANYFFKVPFERPALSELQIRMSMVLAGCRTILGMVMGWLMGERLQGLMDGVYEIAVAEKMKHKGVVAEEQQAKASEHKSGAVAVPGVEMAMIGLRRGDQDSAIDDVEAVDQEYSGSAGTSNSAGCRDCCRCPRSSAQYGFNDMTDEESRIVSHPNWIAFLVLSTRLMFVIGMGILLMAMRDG